jgi:stage IV sporulation protein FB
MKRISKRFLYVAQIKGVNVYAHWTVLLVGAAMLLGAARNARLTFVVLISYMSVLLIHECGHLIAAQRRRYAVQCIELYPIFGFTRFEIPQSRLDMCGIAWGGVIAQAVIGIPLVIWIAVVGYTQVEEINAALAILGVYNLCVAAFNLLPIPPLDGAVAWKLIPALWERARYLRNKRSRTLKTIR